MNLRILGVVVILGARSLPRPSRPWHPAQLDVKLCLPAAEDDRLFPESFRDACAEEMTGVTVKHRQRNNTVRGLILLASVLAIFSPTENSNSDVKNENV